VEAYNTLRVAGQFTSSEQKFASLIQLLQSDKTSKMGHSELEALVEKEGREILRQLCQDHLDLRSIQEQTMESVQGSDGQYRSHRRSGETTTLRLKFGDVEVTRIRYEGRQMGGLCPLDAELNMPFGLCSFGVQRDMVDHAIKMSFEETGLQNERMTGVHVSKRAIEKMTQHAAQDFDTFYNQQPQCQRDDTASPDDLLVLSSDGKGIVVRKRDLREETRKRAEQEKKTKRKKRLSPGQKKNRKRMAVVGAVYSTERNVRTAEQVMGPRESEPMDNVVSMRPKRSRPKNKRVWASLEKDPDVVMNQIFEEALRRDPDMQRQWVFLVDGDLHQLQRIKKLARLYKVNISIVCDFVHILEYMWDASHCFNKVGSDAAEQWVFERAMEVLKGNASLVAGGMRRSATKRDLPKEARKAVDKCARYLLNHKAFLHYDEYLARGYPIASGVIEGTCRHLINDRLDITGARWSLKGAESILKLRSLWASGDLNSYWTYYTKCEFQRNHLVNYAENPVK
jgi:hypothetical protein